MKTDILSRIDPYIPTSGSKRTNSHSECQYHSNPDDTCKSLHHSPSVVNSTHTLDSTTHYIQRISLQLS